jgi:hypothetical protein
MATLMRRDAACAGTERERGGPGRPREPAHLTQVIDNIEWRQQLAGSGDLLSVMFSYSCSVESIYRPLLPKKRAALFFRVRDESLCTTDLWRAGGSPQNKEPFNWARKEGRHFIEFVAGNLDLPVSQVWKVVRAQGGNGGTWAHEKLALACAVTTAEIAAAIREMQSVVKTLSERVKAARKRARETRKPQIDALEAEREAGVKTAVAAIKPWWGNCNAMLAAFSRARSAVLKQLAAE